MIAQSVSFKASCASLIPCTICISVSLIKSLSSIYFYFTICADY
nr:MAG TPA: hypothetical protein [Caudoviricetes sp.]